MERPIENDLTLIQEMYEHHKPYYNKISCVIIIHKNEGLAAWREKYKALDLLMGLTPEIETKWRKTYLLGDTGNFISIYYSHLKKLTLYNTKAYNAT
ncbi:MAG: hypothetical protein FWE36_07960 [Erysipelotrichales bacterium]|nr:hypothetical protein [Erysipelotrichales bacterium]